MPRYGAVSLRRLLPLRWMCIPAPPNCPPGNSQGHLIEVNAHSLFSKWFSESGKMVLGMFTKIREILEVAIW